jgi:hypothetical protein
VVPVDVVDCPIGRSGEWVWVGKAVVQTSESLECKTYSKQVAK